MAAKAGALLKQRHSKVCEALDNSDSTLRTLVTQFYSMEMIDATTKAAIFRRLGYEGADMLMDLLEMKVDSKPERLQQILQIMVQNQVLRDIFEDVVEIKEENHRGNNSTGPQRIPVVIESSQPRPPTSESTHPPLQNDPTDSTVDSLRVLIKQTIDAIYSKLYNATSGSLSDLIRLLFQNDLITSELVSDPNYDKMMKSFYSTLDFDETIDELKEDCAKFIRCLYEVGGPARKAGVKISTDLNKAVTQKLGFEFKTSSF